MNKFQFGFRYNFTEALIVKSALQYGISRFLFNADYRYYFADKVYDKMKFAGKFSYVFPKSKNRISYIFRYKQLDTDNSEISSAFSVEIVL